MALAVSIGEALALWASTPRVRFFDWEEDGETWEEERKSMSKYLGAERELAVVGVDLSRHHFNY